MLPAAFFFDLAGTLYDDANDMFAEINRRLDVWVGKIIPGCPDCTAVRDRLFEKYGGTLLEYGSDFCASLRYCHDIRTDDYLQPDPELRAVLQQLPGRKYIFTSSYRFYAGHVLESLDISDCFDGIIDAIDVFPHPKPSPLSFRRALEITAEPDVSRCVFLDDQPRNVAAGHLAGFFSVQIGTKHPLSELADGFAARIEDILTIPNLLGKDESVL